MNLATKITNLEGFKKVDYISKRLHLTRRELARILELRTEDITGVLDKGHVDNQVNGNQIYNRLYDLHMLYSYLLKMADYKVKPLQRLWKETDFWNSVTVKPPWYERGIKNFLLRGKLNGLENCLLYIQEY